MAIRAYYDGYLDEAQDALGNMMDYAVNTCGMDGDDFFHMFLSSGTARQFERGNPRYLAGMTGGFIRSHLYRKFYACIPRIMKQMKSILWIL